jgi:hypothetical protein
MRNDNTPCHCKNERLNIDLVPFERDERTKYIEHVLDVLLDSRYGPNRQYPTPVDLKPRTDVYEPEFYDSRPHNPLPTIYMDLYKQEFITGITRDLVMKPQQVIDPAAQGVHAAQNSPTTLARGSPPCNCDIQ